MLQSPTSEHVRRPQHRQVRRQVLARHQPAAVLHLGHQRRTDGTLGEQPGPAGGEVVEDVGEVGVAGLLAAGEQRAVGAGHQRVRLGVGGEQAVGRDRQVARGGMAHRVPVPRRRRRRPDQPRPRQPRVALVRHRERRHDARRRHRAVTGVHRHAAAVRRDDLAHAAAEALLGQPAARHLDVPVDDDRVPVGRPDRDVAPAGEADHARLGRHGDERGRQGGVDGVAALGRDSEAGFERLPTGRGHRHVHRAYPSAAAPGRQLSGESGVRHHVVFDARARLTYP